MVEGQIDELQAAIDAGEKVRGGAGSEGTMLIGMRRGGGRRVVKVAGRRGVGGRNLEEL